MLVKKRVNIRKVICTKLSEEPIYTTHTHTHTGLYLVTEKPGSVQVFDLLKIMTNTTASPSDSWDSSVWVRR